MCQFEIIFYVADQTRSAKFYSALFGSPTLDVPGMTEFSLADNLKLGLMPESGIVKIIRPVAPDPKTANGVPRCELYIKDSRAHQMFFSALKAGAVKVSDIEPRDWGDDVGYAMDFDGNILAFASHSVIK